MDVQLAISPGAHDAVNFVWRLLSVGGLVAMIGAAYVVSSDRHAVKWKTVLWGVGLQLLFGVLILKTPLGRSEASTEYRWRPAGTLPDSSRSTS